MQIYMHSFRNFLCFLFVAYHLEKLASVCVFGDVEFREGVHCCRSMFFVIFALCRDAE